MNFWRNRYAELHGLETEDAEKGSSENPSKAKEKTQTSEQPDSAPPMQSYADMNRKCCLLCSRQFKTEAEVNKHERLSQLHRDNLKNEDLRSKAITKLEKAGIKVWDTPAYRDRARERRAAFNQPKRPAPEAASSRPTQATSAAPGGEDKPAQSKGAALLGKMGWTAGEALGAENNGILAPVATDLYVQGVGLGAEGGKLGDAVHEAGRNTAGDYGQFLERTKDKAKERFQRMA